MSERIKELAEQAGAGWDYKYHWYVGSETMQKFAELIVGECANIVKGSPGNLPRGYKAVDQAALVKRHFGLNKDEP